MACGVPQVVTAVGGTRESVDAPRPASSSSRTTRPPWPRAINALLHDPARRAAMSRGVAGAPRGVVHRDAHGARYGGRLRRRRAIALRGGGCAAGAPRRLGGSGSGSGSSASSAAGTAVASQPPAASVGRTVAAARRPSVRPGGRSVAWCASESTLCMSPSRSSSSPNQRAASPKPPASAAAVTEQSTPRSTIARSRARVVAQRRRALRVRQQHAVAARQQPLDAALELPARSPAPAASPAAGSATIAEAQPRARLVAARSAISCVTSAPASSSTGDSSRSFATPASITSGVFCQRRETCGVATTVVVPSTAAARNSASASARDDGPSSMPGMAWQWRSISTRRGRR